MDLSPLPFALTPVGAVTSGWDIAVGKPPRSIGTRRQRMHCFVTSTMSLLSGVLNFEPLLVDRALRWKPRQGDLQSCAASYRWCVPKPRANNTSPTGTSR